MKKVLSILLSIIMVFSAFSAMPFSALADNPSTESTCTINFTPDTNFSGLSKLYVYYWAKSNSISWPGEQMKKNGDSFTATVSLDFEPEGLIFSDGSNQTPDLTFTMDGVERETPEVSGLLSGKYTITNGGSSATVTTYDIYIGGTQVTSANADDVFGDGKASYNAETQTLTLNNYVYSGAGYTYTQNRGPWNETFQYGIYAELSTLNIELIGENKINVSGVTEEPKANRQIYSYGIYLNLDNNNMFLNINGDPSSSLTVTTGDLSNNLASGMRQYGIYTDYLTVSGGCTVKASTGNSNCSNSTSYAVRPYRYFTIHDGSTLEAVSTAYSGGIGIWTSGYQKSNVEGTLIAKGSAKALNGGQLVIANGYFGAAYTDINATEGKTDLVAGVEYNYDTESNNHKYICVNPIPSIDSVRAVGSGGTNFLNDKIWDINAEENNLTEVSPKVWEITYNNVASGVCSFKFAINGSWDINFGADSEVPFENEKEQDAIYYSTSNIIFMLPSDNYTVTLQLDLSEFDYSTKTGAKYTVTIIPPVEKYDLYIGGTQITSANADDVFGTGRVSFDAQTNTLTLSGAMIKGTDSESGLYGVINSKLPELNIKLIGENTIDGEGFNDGIDASGGCNINIIGDGSLNINNAYYGTYIGYYAIPGGNLTIKDGATVTVTDSLAAGLWANHDVNIENSNVVINRSSGSYNGLVASTDGTLTVTDSTLDITNKSSAILLGNADGTTNKFVLNSGTVKLNTENYGIEQGYDPMSDSPVINATIEINGGTLDITSGKGGTNITNIIFAQGLGYSEGTTLSDSGKIVIEKHTHSYTEEVTPPTCTEKGYTTHICNCGESYVDTYVDALGHDYQTNVIAPTQTTLGYTEQKCTRCGDVLSVSDYTAPTGKQTLKCKARTAAAQTVTWNKVDTATGYQVQISSKDGKKWSTYATIKSNDTVTYTFKKLAAGNNYKFRIRFYINAADGKNYFSPWSKTLNSPTAPTGTSFTKITTNGSKFTAQWKRNKTVNGYQIQYSLKSNFSSAKTVTIKNNKTLKLTLKRLNAKKVNYVRIRTYKTINKANYFSAWSKSSTSPTLPKGTTLTKVTPGSKSFTAQWKQNKSVNGYQVQYSLKSNFSGAKTVTIKNNKTLKTTVKNLSAKKTYYVRIRTYKTISGANYFSTWSKAVKVKTK